MSKKKKIEELVGREKRKAGLQRRKTVKVKWAARKRKPCWQRNKSHPLER